MHDRAVQERALLDHHVAADDGELAQLRAGLDLGVVTDAQRPGKHASGSTSAPSATQMPGDTSNPSISASTRPDSTSACAFR